MQKLFSRRSLPYPKEPILRTDLFILDEHLHPLDQIEEGSEGEGLDRRSSRSMGDDLKGLCYSVY